jgi:hypothetical protein
MRRSQVLALALLATACTTPPNAPAGAAGSDVDQERMSTIEGHALERGAKVYWVNPPRKEQGSGG